MPKSSFQKKPKGHHQKVFSEKAKDFLIEGQIVYWEKVHKSSESRPKGHLREGQYIFSKKAKIFSGKARNSSRRRLQGLLRDGQKVFSENG